MFKTSISTTFRSFHYRNYRLFFAGQGISLIGTWMQRIAVGWLVYRLTNSPYMLGIATFASQIPTFIFAPFGGVLADRFNKHRLLILSQVLAMFQAAILAVFAFSNSIDVLHIIIISSILGVVNAIDIPVRQSFVVDMIKDKERDLSNAIALNSTMFNIARMIGPSIAGILVASIGEAYCFFLNSVSYLAVIICLLFMKFPESELQKVKERKKIIQDFKEGFSYVVNTKEIRNIILFLSLISLVAMPYVVLMPIFAKEILKGNATTLGFLMSSAGIGSFVGALSLASKKENLGLLKTITVSGFVFGTGLVLLSFIHVFIVSMLILAVICFYKQQRKKQLVQFYLKQNMQNGERGI